MHIDSALCPETNKRVWQFGNDWTRQLQMQMHLAQRDKCSGNPGKKPNYFQILIFFSPATYTVAEKNNPSGQSASLPLCNFAFLRLSMIWSIANRARCKSLQIHIDSGTLLWWDKCSGIPGKKLHRQIWAKFFQQRQKQTLQYSGKWYFGRSKSSRTATWDLYPGNL